MFLVAGVANNSLVHAHLILSGIRLRALHADPVFAGEAMRLKLRFEADGARERPGLELPGGRGPEHRHACLRALALLPEAGADHG